MSLLIHLKELVGTVEPGSLRVLLILTLEEEIFEALERLVPIGVSGDHIVESFIVAR